MIPQGGFLNPDTIISSLNIKTGYNVADFGSGSGYFALLIAAIVGDTGSVTAIDVLQGKLDTLKSAAQSRGLFNINYVRGDLEVWGSSKLNDSSQDVALLTNILFQSQKKLEIIKEAHRVLKIGGELVVIDWEPTSLFGTKEAGYKFSKAECQQIVAGLGFNLDKEIITTNDHWGLLFKKNF
ncbi:MAG: methyltransferase domain-containing protein [bacterium]|nr:methyltransferase domain-containing protein [bacterium]